MIESTLGTGIKIVTVAIKLLKGEMTFDQAGKDLAGHFQKVGETWKKTFTFKYGVSDKQKEVSDRLELEKKIQRSVPQSSNDLFRKPETNMILKDAKVEVKDSELKTENKSSSGSSGSVFHVKIEKIIIESDDIKDTVDFYKKLKKEIHAVVGDE
jgi:hypothetical protein